MPIVDLVADKLDTLCFNVFQSYAKYSISDGSITFQLSDGTEALFGQTPPEGIVSDGGDGDGCSCGADLHAFVKVNSMHAFTRIVFESDIGLGEAYMHKEIECAHPTRLLKVLCNNAEELTKGTANGTVLGWFTYFGLGLAKLEHLLHANTIEGSKRNISAHYDIGNDLYKEFLDETLTYSCGFYEHANSTLYESQLAKLDKMITAAGIKDGDHVLEIGSGWGSMAIRTSQKFPNVKFTSLTLSNEQRQEAITRIEKLGLQDRVQILYCDYRTFISDDNEGTFDAVVSIEMIEAVGHENLPQYFSVVARALKPNGKVAIQAITMPDHKYNRYRNGSDFIRKYIFPGGHLPSIGAMNQAAVECAGLLCLQSENIGLHYATTLAAWHERFVASSKIKSSCSDLFFRTWRFYFAYCEAGFATNYIQTHQVVFQKPDDNSLKRPSRFQADENSIGLITKSFDVVRQWYFQFTNARKIAVSSSEKN